VSDHEERCQRTKQNNFTVYNFISLIYDKSFRTQNLTFLSYWYRKKCLQMHL
jgi:hypothetical protein